MAQRILVAGVPETFRRMSLILTGYPSPDLVDNLAAAQSHLQSATYDLVLVGAHFDESRMFDLIRDIKAGQHAHVPVLCYRATVGAETRTKLTMQAIGIAVRTLGAADFLDLFDYRDDEAGNLALRKLIKATLETNGVPLENI